jgi:hypothetical protein
MLTDITSFFDALLGLDAHAQALTYGQVAARALLIYLAGFAMLRFGEHRFLGKNTAFDVILGFVFGSLLSRAINGGDPLLPTLLAGLILLSLHWLFATASLHSEGLRKLITGDPIPLVKEGKRRGCAGAVSTSRCCGKTCAPIATAPTRRRCARPITSRAET